MAQKRYTTEQIIGIRGAGKPIPNHSRGAGRLYASVEIVAQLLLYSLKASACY